MTGRREHNVPSAYMPRQHSGAATPSMTPAALSSSYPMTAYSQHAHPPPLVPMSLPPHSYHPLHLHVFAPPPACLPDPVAFSGTPALQSDSVLLYAQCPTCHCSSQRGGLLWAVPFSGSLAQTNLQITASLLDPTTPAASMADPLLSATPVRDSRSCTALCPHNGIGAVQLYYCMAMAHL